MKQGWEIPIVVTVVLLGILFHTTWTQRKKEERNKARETKGIKEGKIIPLPTLLTRTHQNLQEALSQTSEKFKATVNSKGEVIISDDHANLFRLIFTEGEGIQVEKLDGGTKRNFDFHESSMHSAINSIIQQLLQYRTRRSNERQG